jgi:hypothetical protein
MSRLTVVYSIQKQQAHLAASVMGTLVGGIVLGALFFFGAAYAHRRWTMKKAKTSNVSNVEKDLFNPPYTPQAQPVMAIDRSASFTSAMSSPSISISSPPAAPTTPRGNGHLHPEFDSLSRASSTNSTRVVNPFLDQEPGLGARSGKTAGLPRSPRPERTNSLDSESVDGDNGGGGQQVYVIHVDGGSVVELPPTYSHKRNESRAEASSSTSSDTKVTE